MYLTVDIQQPFGTIAHRWHPADANCRAYGTLKLGGDQRVSIYFNTAADVDAVIAELTALRAEMTGGPEAEKVPWPTGLCGHTVTPGAWSQGYAKCRDCLPPDAVAAYDRATAGEQLPQAVTA
jgi:hypothetical protein